MDVGFYRDITQAFDVFLWSDKDRILEGILEEETNILQPDMNVAAIPSEIEPKATMPSVGEITPSPPSSLDK